MGKINIAIDGHAGCGKSSTAKEIAKRIGYLYVDTGLMYRALAYYLHRCMEKEPGQSLHACLDDLNVQISTTQEGIRIILNGEEIKESLLRTEKIGRLASQYSQYPEVRHKLVSIQRSLAQSKGVIMEGRDIGTVVLPDAELKIFMTAALPVRIERRYQQLIEKGVTISKKEVAQEIIQRDKEDMEREIAPLKPAPDAILVDTTNLTFEDQVEYIIKLIREKEKELCHE